MAASTVTEGADRPPRSAFGRNSTTGAVDALPPAGSEPCRDQRALFARHLGHIARRHCARPRRVTTDQAGVATDMVGLVKQDAFGRCDNRCPDRLCAMAHAASRQNDLFDAGEAWR